MEWVKLMCGKIKFYYFILTFCLSCMFCVDFKRKENCYPDFHDVDVWFESILQKYRQGRAFPRANKTRIMRQ